jgi:hypothetical protein
MIAVPNQDGISPFATLSEVHGAADTPLRIVGGIVDSASYEDILDAGSLRPRTRRVSNRCSQINHSSLVNHISISQINHITVVAIHKHQLLENLWEFCSKLFHRKPVVVDDYAI